MQQEQTLATRGRRSAVPPPSLGDVLSDALARAQAAKPARAKKGGERCPVRVASGLFAGSEFDKVLAGTAQVTAEFVASKAAERRLRRACLRRAVCVVVACNRLERAGAERKLSSNNCSSSTVVGRAAASQAVPPSHPLLGDGIEADDLLIEIASWLTAAECRALAACRLRFHALASFTG